jgi:uncharacterized protein
LENIMNYQVGQVGRTFVARFEDGEPVIQPLIELIRRENVRAAVLYLLGGIKKGRIVVGPEREESPPTPEWRELPESHETVAIGTVFWQGSEPKIHLHGAFGKKDAVRVGCLREQGEAFIILEAIILELAGITATRALDPASNMVLMTFGEPSCDGL